MSLHRYTPEFITTHTPCMGMNGAQKNSLTHNGISTHTPVWGWTEFQKCYLLGIAISTHITRKGMNLCHYIATHQNLLQPTPPHGDELHSFKEYSIAKILQPTPPYGDERLYATRKKQSIYISTHTPVRGWTFCCCMCGCLRLFQPTPPHGRWTFYKQC